MTSRTPCRSIAGQVTGQSSSETAGAGDVGSSGTWWYRSKSGLSTDMGNDGGRGMSCG